MAVNYRRNIVTFTEVARRATVAAYGANLPQLIRGDNRVGTHELALCSNRNAGESFLKAWPWRRLFGQPDPNLFLNTPLVVAALFFFSFFC